MSWLSKFPKTFSHVYALETLSMLIHSHYDSLTYNDHGHFRDILPNCTVITLCIFQFKITQFTHRGIEAPKPPTYELKL